jgi:membrane fusion protein, copper/silver efflux system
MTTYKVIFFVLVLCGGFTFGWMMNGSGVAAPSTKTTAAPADAGPQHWTCPMHAEIDLPSAGKCPKCGMDLVERKSGGEDAGPRTLVMSESDKKLAEIVTAPVERKFVIGSINLVGKIDYDETRVKTISAWVPGRLDRLFVDYTGVPVRKGDHLVEMYSPDFLTAQEELIEAKKQVDAAIEERSEFLRRSNERALDSARDKLRLWGLTAPQIATIEASGKVEDHVQINSPMTGIVIHKNLNKGDYVKTGTRIYKIADLSHLWVQLDAYESDLPYIRYGQEVSIQTESYPGRVFRGWVSFIDPVLNERTQTIRVRVNVENGDALLKPGMFVRTRIASRPGLTGGGIDPRFKGKWICPMHPEVVEDETGTCRVCGMNLVKAEELGQLAQPDTSTKPLVIPVTAALITGRRAVVYVQVPGKDRPTFEGREVELGPRAGEYYHVVSGLEEGEVVVVNGNFKIDSALQILAKPSMMSMPADPSPMQGREFLGFRNSIEPIYTAYFEIQQGLAKDDAKSVLEPYRKLDATLAKLPRDSDALPTEESKTVWGEIRTDLLEATGKAQTAANLTAARDAFRDLSRRVLTLEKTFGHSQAVVHTEVFCPMAFKSKGAAWLQPQGPVTNPYFGTAMLSCGEEKKSYAGRGGPGAPKPARSEQPTTRKSGAAKNEKMKHDHGKMPAKKPQGTEKPKETTPKEFRVALDPLWKSYLQAQAALATDALPKTKSALSDLTKTLDSINDSTLQEPARRSWSSQRKSLGAAARRGAAASDLAAARSAFRDATTAVLAIEKQFGHRGTSTYYEMFCPMAFGGKGGTWLQTTDQVSNPYYGANMLRCGSVKQQHKAAQER